METDKSAQLYKLAGSGGRQPAAGGKRKGLGELAVASGLITDAQLALALQQQQKSGRPLPELLQELCGLARETVQELLAADAGIDKVDLARVTIESEALAKVSSDFAMEHRLVPISLAQNRLTVAMANPFDLAALDQLQFMTRLYINARYAPESKIVDALGKFYGIAADVPGQVEKVEKKADRESYAKIHEGEETIGPHVIRLVDALLGRGIREEATDIHIEPEENNLKVRFRIDGILHLRPGVTKSLQPAVITRIKIMANMDISENRVPQDGRISFSWEGKSFDLRVSTFPMIYGEKVVLRVLDKEKVVVGLEKLGFSPAAQLLFERSVRRPHGIILVTGPTGSGKTTTLYSTLVFINSAEKNIITLEDPVEYEIPDIQQSQINPKAGLTFATGLRAVLRQDPDIIFVGEMRDSETVDVAIRAALTGHLVFSTLHTNDAVGSISRLLDMEVNPSLMASTFVAIVGQRLVRKICSHCKELATPDPALLQLAGLADKNPAVTFYRGAGCARCLETGYRGRIGIYEILAVTPGIAQLISQRQPDQVIQQKAKEEGFTTMMEDGLEKVARGLTTLDEVIRVAYTV
ncbi:MAG TPA: GspE/PulE family protein [Candidatus Binatia bacterium]|jgi:type IV pilus assembly protein PilB